MLAKLLKFLFGIRREEKKHPDFINGIMTWGKRKY